MQFFFEKLDVEEGKKVTFDKVVLVSEDKKVEVGAPYVKGVKVEGKVVANGKGKKSQFTNTKLKRITEELRDIDNHIQRLK